MNFVDIRKIISQTTTSALTDKMKAVATAEGTLRVLTQELKNMGHNLSFVHAQYPADVPEKTSVGFKDLTITFPSNLIDTLQSNLETDKNKTIVVIETDPLKIGGQQSHISTRAEAYLLRHTTFGSAQHRSIIREKYYDTNHAKRKAKKWNNILGSNMVTYTYGVMLLASDEKRITDSELPLTQSNENRLVKELYHKYSFTTPFNVIGFDAPTMERMEYQAMSKAAQTKAAETLYKKVYKTLELTNRNRAKTLIFTDVGIDGKLIPHDVIATTIKRAFDSFAFTNKNKQVLKNVQFVVSPKLKTELEKAFA